ncbi:MAG: ATP-dependent acyl-CoA ligase [Actinomycetota bacterium]|nr:ATP-dependent acyl-CoA ligase [Actinomycetota bacterium]
MSVRLDLATREQTLPTMLERAASLHGDRPLLRFEDAVWSYRKVRDEASRLASALAEIGIAPGAHVAVMSENRPEVLRLWLACAWTGAVFVPVSTALRGDGLRHALASARPAVLAVEEAFHERVSEAGAEATWILGRGGGLPRGVDPVAPHPVGPGDTCAILYTSGTTGPSKGVLCPHAQWYWWAVKTGEVLSIDRDSVLYTNLPLFHTNALNAFCQALVAGATYVLGPRFSASSFWQRLEGSGATVTYLLGAMVSILLRTPEGEHDRTHRCRIALAPATPAELHAPFFERFGVRLIDAWGSTETNIVISNTLADLRPGTLGRVLDGFEARVADDEDAEVPDGTPGELLLRHREPWAFACGYDGLPEATAAAWRNLWFHTGDRVVRDPDGSFRFVDRLKDVIRRRGENISSYEVEQALLSHPDVAGAAVVPTPSELGEDEVLAFVVVRDGAELDPLELIRFCEPHLPYFAVPRYVDVLTELPLTPSGKVEKYRLRERAVTSSAWDRERSGYTLRR